MANYTTVEGAKVGILMGSSSDWATMKKASEMLDSFCVPHESNAISAHRNAGILEEYLSGAEKRGIELFICAAGGAAHLAGVVAAHTEKPVLGCPMQAWSLDGLDSGDSSSNLRNWGRRGYKCGPFCSSNARKRRFNPL